MGGVVDKEVPLLKCGKDAVGAVAGAGIVETSGVGAGSVEGGELRQIVCLSVSGDGCGGAAFVTCYQKQLTVVGSPVPLLVCNDFGHHL